MSGKELAMDLDNREEFTDEALASLAQKGNQKAREALMRRYRPLVVSLSKERFTASFKEDLEQELWLAFFETLRDYDASKAKFSTAVSKFLRYKRRHVFEKYQKIWNAEVGDENGIYAESVETEDRHPLFEKEEEVDFLTLLRLTPEQETVLRYLREGVQNTAEIGRRMGINQSVAYRLVQRIRRKSEKILLDRA